MTLCPANADLLYTQMTSVILGRESLSRDQYTHVANKMPPKILRVLR